MELTQIEDTFVDIGGQFHTSAFDLRNRLENIKAYIFDWDGVFNDGRKGGDRVSTFSEVDSLGVNMMLFGHFLSNRSLAKTGVITGEASPACLNWAQRENVNAVYVEAKQKDVALAHFCYTHGIEPENVAYFFDDVLDVPVAQKVGIRMAVCRAANPVFIDYLEKNKLVDYKSGSDGNNHAVREFCELMLCLMEKQFEVIDHRAAYDNFYQDYFNHRQQNSTEILEYRNGSIHSRS